MIFIYFSENLQPTLLTNTKCPLKLDDTAIQILQKFRWSGNIRQLRNVAEQLSVLETSRDITGVTLQSYLPTEGSNLPSVIKAKKKKAILVQSVIFYTKCF
jgi:transcriptional regulator with PAS, ATPase and Fis domain